MRKFTKEEKALIEEARIKIKNLEKEQEVVFHRLTSTLKLNSKAEEILSELIFNDLGSLEKVEKQR
jgi:hypothetical protein